MIPPTQVASDNSMRNLTVDIKTPSKTNYSKRLQGRVPIHALRPSGRQDRAVHNGCPTHTKSATLKTPALKLDGSLFGLLAVFDGRRSGHPSMALAVRKSDKRWLLLA